jgi:hypothetical protein
LPDGDSDPIDDETHLDSRRVRAVTLFCDHEREPDFERPPVCFSAQVRARRAARLWKDHDDVWADWEAEKRERFEGRWPKVQEILSAFQGIGIYLLDVSPANIAFLD